MLWQIDFKSGTPVYLQLVEQVRHAAASGALRTGEALPSIRPLAEELRVNRNTIAKAYAELENQGVIETLPGKGCFLKAVNSLLTKSARNDLLAQEIDRAIVAAHHLQISNHDLLALVNQRFEEFNRRHQAANNSKDHP
ncbi:MAG TPA: GntR family transcriptional regulator [Candidatus Acidoferrales bacterium]|nr:GntR family transcriptional regulator [Candidatus Acidoferrales bacterium]